jgi:hypothetical protein
MTFEAHNPGWCIAPRSRTAVIKSVRLITCTVRRSDAFGELEVLAYAE